MGIVIAARELGKSDFLSVRHDFLMRKNVGKKWVCLLKSVGKVESNEVFCGAVEEEEGGEKLVESDLEEDFNVMDQPDDLTLRVDRCNDHLQRADRCDGCLVPRSIGCYNRYRYSAPIAVTIAA
ncbi:hypothetical protein L249_7114 [Ophiocordyceps polyrhachis-furcata BCC 54312]|uniref:Uncharacterized protein n=1 Tax=Ophiocordyceps polyrhachis-furcata BCC 54312 TaxID=1330021 RepID=A0A367LLA8_9HYPO|nr:hypothetical protein L249_7114 [Ophiocordyceps polyrhachis-furcata BCC 54312]